MPGGVDPYPWLLDPIGVATFERTYYQKRFCHFRRGDPARNQSLLSLEDLDTVLGTHGLGSADLNLVQQDRDILPGEYLDSHELVDPLEAARLFDEGATLIFVHLNTRIPKLARFCSAMGQAFSSRIQMNVYLTPPDSQGFKPHWDTHDVFVIQVSGSKSWRIYDTKIELPLKGQRFDPEQHSAGEVTEELELRAGDVLYVPRGLMHSGKSLSETSLHITTGVMAFTWADFLLQSVAATALDEVALRENLPQGFARSEFPAEERARLLREKLEKVATRLEIDPPFPYFCEELLSRWRPSCTNLLSQISRLPDLAPASRVGLREDAVWRFRREDGHSIVRYSGKEVRLPGFALPALRFIDETQRFEVNELPDCMDEASKLTLVKRLVKEGILELLG